MLEHEPCETEPIVVCLEEYDASSRPFEMHYALELGIVLSGQLERLYQRESHSLGPGQVWLCNAWEPHGWRVLESPCRAVVVNVFPPTLASSGFPELAGISWQGPFLVPAGERGGGPEACRPTLRRLGEELAACAELRGPLRLLQLRMLLHRVLLELPSARRANEPLALPRDGWERVNRAVQLVLSERRYVSSAEAARECALSHKALNTLFARTIGTTFAKFALRYRVQAAASRLLATPDPIKAIAHDWGFVDASHFHACFRACYGCSPLRYREAAALSASQPPFRRLSPSPDAAHALPGAAFARTIA